MDTSRHRQQPVDFRKEEVSYVMQRWRAGDSCSLVGVGSVGKSNLLQHLANPQVQKTYINITHSSDFKAIIIDPNMLGPLPQTGDDIDQVRCWAGYELMMHRLFMAFYPFEGLSKEDAQRFYEIYQALQDGTNPLYAYMGLRYFELGLDFFTRRGVRIVFMFDEFEDMLRHMPVKFFQTLRGLRDANKRHLSYLTFTRSPLPALVKQMDMPLLEMEPFVELFTDSLYYVGPYNDADARRMAENLMSRNQKNYPEVTIEFLMWSTGCYAGLMRAAFRILDALGSIDATSMMNDELVRKMVLRRPVRIECETLWLSLSDIEKQTLKMVARLIPHQSSPQTDEAVAMLVQKRLLHVDAAAGGNGVLRIEPPVFRAYVASNPEIEVSETE